MAEAIVNFGKDQNCSMLCSQGGGRIKARACWRRGRIGAAWPSLVFGFNLRGDVRPRGD